MPAAALPLTGQDVRGACGRDLKAGDNGDAMARRALTPADRRKRVLDHLAARGAKGATAGELREYTGGGGMKAAEFRQVLEPLVAGGLVTAAVGAILWGRGWTREAVIYRIAGEGTHDHESPE